MNRRDFLRMLSMTPLALGLDRALALPGAGPAPGPGPGRTLVLIELSGGNDGLNTVVPYADPAYHAARPTLALDRDTVLGITPTLGLHPALEPLVPLFEEGSLGILLGVGYPDPNRSHFRSIEIWETGSTADAYLDDGWLARALRRTDRSDGRAADALVLGRDEGPVAGRDMRTVVMQGQGRMLRAAARLRELRTRRENPALAHILRVQANLRSAAREIQERFAAARPLSTPFPRHRLGRQLEAAARARAAGLRVPVLKLGLGGFDHHAGQAGPHARLLGQLGEGLAAFAAAMKELGQWDQVLVMTYGEFGRRVAENGSRGTDHGTAAPHLVLGGRVEGGLHGRQPSLTELDGGDLRFHLDYRDVYATVAERWLQVAPASLFPGHRPTRLEFLRA